ncbi:MAG: Rne/Rng family ribonuclease [Candidatus Omnitrophica bacterium]|nr:Rne/Rng family ribonuclease [Candidatus Omnitrophota bacterium]
MAKEILIHIAEGERRVAILQDGKLDDFYIEVDRQQSLLGNIYKGRVESILPSINGAFVNIGQERNGFLYLTDADHPFLNDLDEVEEEVSGARKIIDKIFGRVKKKKEEKKVRKPEPLSLKQGQEILVQVVKDPFAAKGARLTTHITLAGRFVVYMPVDKHSGISKKIDTPEERQRLRDILRECTFVKSGGFIVRTASQDQGKREITRDAKFLVTIWDKVRGVSKQKQAPALIYKEYDLILKVVRDFLKEDVTRLVIDSEEEYHKMRKFVQTLIGKEMVDRIHLHKGPAPLFSEKNVAHELEKIYDQKVYLKSGAYVVIEPTEGLIVVDVNSGRFKSRGTPEEAAFQVNMEAAPEIARQLRLRDLGGIIVIDFIDMNREDHKRKVLTALKEALAQDHSKTEVNRISPLGLVEMTRARAGNTVESLKFHKCPYCEGRGRVKID